MPSPVAHAAMGYIIYRISRSSLPQQAGQRIGLLPRLLLTTTALSLLPDLDAIPGILLGDLKQFHNNITHSLVFGLVVASGIAGMVRLKQRAGFWRWFLITLLCYQLHVLMDFFTIGGRGVLILWPFSLERYEPAVKLFYGLRWSDGLISVRHGWTLLTELAFAILLGLSVHTLLEYKRSGLLRRWLGDKTG